MEPAETPNASRTSAMNRLAVRHCGFSGFRARKVEFVFNRREIHKVGDNFGIVGNMHGHSVNRKQE